MAAEIRHVRARIRHGRTMVENMNVRTDNPSAAGHFRGGDITYCDGLMGQLRWLLHHHVGVAYLPMCDAGELGPSCV